MMHPRAVWCRRGREGAQFRLGRSAGLAFRERHNYPRSVFPSSLARKKPTQTCFALISAEGERSAKDSCGGLWRPAVGGGQADGDGRRAVTAGGPLTALARATRAGFVAVAGSPTPPSQTGWKGGAVRVRPPRYSPDGSGAVRLRRGRPG